jgi:hypothetical protein
MRAEGDSQRQVREDVTAATARAEEQRSRAVRRSRAEQWQSGGGAERSNGKGGRRQIGCNPGAVRRPAKTPHSSLPHPARPCHRRLRPKTAAFPPDDRAVSSWHFTEAPAQPSQNTRP